MRVFNQEKTQELTNYDLSKGYLKQDKLIIAFHPEQKAKEGSYHIEEKNYPNGGKSIEKVWDILPTPYKKAYEEYEDIQVYVPYTEKELAQLEIVELKHKLLETDYKAIKYAEGVLTESEYALTKQERQSWRNRINELQNIYGV